MEMGHRKPKFFTRFFGSLALAALIAVPAWAQNSAAASAPSQHPETAAPGAINYVEGHVKIGSETLSSASVGKVQLKPGQTLETEDGRVEMLLTPGVFIRLGQDTSVTMVSPSLTNTKVKVDTGEATAEVDEYHSQNNLMVQVDDATAYLVHTGFYDFDPQQGLIRVLKGQAVVLRDDYHVRVNPGRQVELFPQTAKLQAVKFDVGQYKKQNPLYSWSKLRSQYLAEANVNEAPHVYGWNGWGPGWYGPGWWGAGLGWGAGWGPGWSWYGPGWYWNPWFMSYTFIPGGGVYYSPFGWGFYSPRYVERAPYAVQDGHLRDFNRGFDSWGLRGVGHTPSVRVPHIAHAFRGRGAGDPGEHFGTYGRGFHSGDFRGGFAGRR
jgi:FecR protein